MKLSNFWQPRCNNSVLAATDLNLLEGFSKSIETEESNAAALASLAAGLGHETYDLVDINKYCFVTNILRYYCYLQTLNTEANVDQTMTIGFCNIANFPIPPNNFKMSNHI